MKRGFDYVGVSVCAICHDGKGNFLLQKRGKEARDEQGHWDICGGALDYGNTIEKQLRQELMEELCVEPEEIKFLAVGDAHRTHAGQQTHWVWILHAVKVDPKKVKIGEPHKIEELGWFTTKNLPSPMHSQYKSALNAALAAGVIK